MEKKYIANPNYTLREIAGEAVLVSVGKEIADFCGIVNLNMTAKILWEKLQNGATELELQKELLDVFQVSEEIVVRDVHGIINLLLERGLIYEG